MNQDLIQDRMMSNPYPSPGSNTFTMPQPCPRPLPSPGPQFTLCIKLQPNPIFKPHPAVQQLPQVLCKTLTPVTSLSPCRKSSPHTKIQIPAPRGPSHSLVPAPSLILAPITFLAPKRVLFRVPSTIEPDPIFDFSPSPCTKAQHLVQPLPL